jgi:hypothetical protein
MADSGAQTEINPLFPLLLLCARPIVNERAASNIRALVKMEPNWATLLNAAADHGVIPLVCQRLEICAGDLLPSAWRERFRNEFARNIRHTLFLTSELLRVLGALNTRGVRATPHKGPILAVQAYRDVAMRQFFDLDIVVPQREILEAHLALTDLGYRSELEDSWVPSASEATAQIPGQYAYRSDAPVTYVELHTESTLRYMPLQLDLEPLLRRRKTLSLAGNAVQTFCAEDVLVLLGVHGAKHFWNQLGWIADIAALIQNSRELEWELVLSRARNLAAERMVLLGAALARELFGTVLPEHVTKDIERDGVARRLCIAVGGNFLAGPRVQCGVFRRFAFRLQMCGRNANRFRYVLRLAATPTELDNFGPFCAVLRPFRLVRVYGWRTYTADDNRWMPSGDVLSTTSIPLRSEVHCEVREQTN